MQSKTIKGYKITDDIELKYQNDGTNAQLMGLIEKIVEEAESNDQINLIQSFTDLVQKIPNSPYLKNLLYVIYLGQDNVNQAFEINNWILKEHPDYLVAKLNLARKYLKDNELEKISSVLGKALNLNKLFPNRDVFETDEVLSFLGFLVEYYIETGQIEKAKAQLEIMKEIDFDHNETRYAIDSMVIKPLKKSISQNGQKNVKEIVGFWDQNSNNLQFNHQEIIKLYEYGLNIPENIMTQI